MTQPTRRTSGAANGIKSGPRRIPAYRGWDSAGKNSSDVGIGLMRFCSDSPALAPATAFDLQPAAVVVPGAPAQYGYQILNFARVLAIRELHFSEDQSLVRARLALRMSATGLNKRCTPQRPMDVTD